MKLRLCLVLSTVLGMVAFATADDKKAHETKAPSAEEQAMMEAWMKAATPNDAHKKLDPFIGTWDTKVTSWMQPGAPPETTTGVSTNSWALGGRYVEQRFTGTFMGEPFHGIGYTGYDNTKKAYVGTWMDNASTSVMMTTGKVDPSGKSMSFSGTMDDPMSGKAMQVEEKINILDNDHHTMEMWSPGPDGTMYKNMQIDYKRKK